MIFQDLEIAAYHLTWRAELTGQLSTCFGHQVIQQVHGVLLWGRQGGLC